MKNPPNLSANSSPTCRHPACLRNITSRRKQACMPVSWILACACSSRKLNRTQETLKGMLLGWKGLKRGGNGKKSRQIKECRYPQESRFRNLDQVTQGS